MEKVKAILLKQMEILSQVCDTEATPEELPELTDAMLGIAVLLMNNAPAGHGEGRDTEYYAECFHKRLDKIYQDFLLLQQEATQEKPDGIIKRFRRFIGS